MQEKVTKKNFTCKIHRNNFRICCHLKLNIEVKMLRGMKQSIGDYDQSNSSVKDICY